MVCWICLLERCVLEFGALNLLKVWLWVDFLIFGCYFEFDYLVCCLFTLRFIYWLLVVV